MANEANEQHRVVYNSRQSPRSNNNRHYAKLNGLKFDPDFELYRDPFGFVLSSENPTPHSNPVDCWR